jgi:sterol desaturase/sphingolipid hydroxylase (fatty acid hydroxylase superfamily)
VNERTIIYTETGGKSLMTGIETGFVYFFIILGAFEVISNTYHLTRGSKERIGHTAKKQHQELPNNLSAEHYVAKAIVMLIFGVVFLALGVLTLLSGQFLYWPALTTMIALILYSLIQAVMYRKTWSVWTAVLAHSLPLIVYILFS